MGTRALHLDRKERVTAAVEPHLALQNFHTQGELVRVPSNFSDSHFWSND